MIYAYPEYYKDFACIAGDCCHSCCIGWEIDIDETTAKKYRSFDGALGARMQRCIDWQTDPPHFILGEGERCPFLNERGLCDIILEKGEDAISQICTDHPRFRSFMDDREEIGLGLCCEAAGRLLLGDDAPMQLAVIGDDGEDETADPVEEELLLLRDSLFAAMQDRTLPIARRVEKLLSADTIDWQDWAGFLMKLERLDERWTELLRLLPGKADGALHSALEKPMDLL